MNHDSRDQARDLEQLMACYDDEGNTLVYRLAFLTALLTQEAALLYQVTKKKKGKTLTLLDVLCKKGFDLGDDFPIEWYDGLNYDGKGLISLVDTIEMYRLEDLRGFFER
jgi:hypothetical protein